MHEGVTRTRLDPEADEMFLPLRRQLGVTAFGINQIRLSPGQRGRIHRHHRQEEVYLVIEGTLTLVVEGDAHDLGGGEIVRVAPGVRRQLVNRHREPVLLLALGADGEHAGRDGEAFTDWEQSEGAPPQEVPAPSSLDASELSD